MSHTCPECQREFKNPLALAVHFGRMHKEKKAELDPKKYPFLCQICNTRRFKSQRGLNYHLSMTHGIKFSEEEKDQRQVEATKRYNIKKRKEQPQLYKYKCPLCEFRGISKGGLSTHLTRMHPTHLYFKYPVHVGHVELNGKIPEKRSKYDEKTIKWLDHLSDKNLLMFYLSKWTSQGLIISLKRNKIFKNTGRRGRGNIMTAYGEELLSELKNEGRVKRSISVKSGRVKRRMKRI